MMCPKKVFFGILSAVVLMPLQSSAFGPGEDVTTPPAKSVASSAAQPATKGVAAQPTATTVAAPELKSRRLMNESELANYGITLSHELKPRRDETQFKLLVSVPAALKKYLVVEVNKGMGTYRISLEGVPVDVLDLDNPDAKKLEGRKLEHRSVLIAGEQMLDPALEYADADCVRDHTVDRCLSTEAFLDKPIKSKKFEEKEEKDKLAAKEKKEKDLFCKKLENKLLKKVCESCGVEAEKERNKVIEDNREKIAECNLTAKALTVSEQIGEFLVQKQCDSKLAALKAGKLGRDEMKSIVGGDSCSSQLKSEDVAAAYKVSFWKRDIQNAEDLALLMEEAEDNKDKLDGLKMQDLLRGKLSAVNLAQANDPALIQAMINAQTKYLNDEAAFCASKDTEFSAADKSHCKFVLPNAMQSLQQFSGSYLKEAANIAKRGEEYQRGVAECQSLGPDAGGCLQQLAQKANAAASAVGQPGASGVPVVASAVQTTSAPMSALSPNGLPYTNDPGNSNFGVYGTPINTSAYFNPAQPQAASAPQGQAASNHGRLPDRRS